MTFHFQVSPVLFFSPGTPGDRHFSSLVSFRFEDVQISCSRDVYVTLSVKTKYDDETRVPQAITMSALTGQIAKLDMWAAKQRKNKPSRVQFLFPPLVLDLLVRLNSQLRYVDSNLSVG